MVIDRTTGLFSGLNRNQKIFVYIYLSEYTLVYSYILRELIRVCKDTKHIEYVKFLIFIFYFLYYILNHFIEVWFTNKRLYIYNENNLMSLEISV